MQRMRTHVLNVLILSKRSDMTHEINHRDTAKIAAISMVETTHRGGSNFKLETTGTTDPTG
jgi:hypothetical protein